MQDFNAEDESQGSAILERSETKTEINPEVPTNPVKLQKPVLQCKYCPKKYKVLGALKKHKQWCPQRKDLSTEEKQPENPNEDVVENLKEEQESKMNVCKECGQKFKYAKILQKHEAMHKGKYPYWCKLCMLNFSTYGEKVLHKMDKHPCKDKKRTCRICPNKIFDSEEEHLYHITEVHKGKYDDYFMCSDCGKQFKTKSEFTHHNNSKCGTIKQYKCKVCDQELMTAGSLHNHMLRHTGERCCMCGYCGKMFLTAGQLKVHERTHTQEKAFVCHVCGKGFCHRQSLITHSTLHTGVKPYQCDNCGHSFSCVGNLIKHRRTHAETCGAVPLTTHRVNNPSTKMKVKMNTPKSSKLKMLRKERELQEKLAAYKEKLSRRSSTSETEGNQSNNSSDVKFKLSSQSSDCSAEDKSVLADNKNGNLSSCKFEVKSENHNDLSYIGKDGFEFEDAQLNKNYSNSLTDELESSNKEATNKHSDGCEMGFFKVRDDLYNYSNEFPIDEETTMANSDIKSKSPTEIQVNLNNTLEFEDINTTKSDSSNEKPEDYLCQMEDLNDNLESTDNYYEDDEHDSCEDIEMVQELNVVESKQSEGSLKSIRKSKKRKQETINENEVEEFVKQRGLDGATEVTCQYCKRTYTNLRWLLRHEKGHNKKPQKTEVQLKNPYKCSCCKVGFETREECKVHQQNMHADILTCQDCDKLFSNVDSLRSHQNIFHKGLPRRIYIYICEKCGLQFRQKASLLHHENSNCGAGPVYDCHVCGKSFNSMHTRRSHMRIHDPKKRFLCKFCGKSFRWKGQLKIHERSHTGEKPFKCLYCPKAFGYRESLITHSSLHTGVKPYLCQACGSRFSCIGNLIKHRGTHASTCGVWYSKNQ